MAFPTSPRTSSAFQSTRSRVLDTTYLFAASIVRAKGSSNQAALPSAPAATTLPPSFRTSPGQREGHRPGRGSRPRDDANLRLSTLPATQGTFVHGVPPVSHKDQGNR